jgi:hypothetical protein
VIRKRSRLLIADRSGIDLAPPLDKRMMVNDILQTVKVHDVSLEVQTFRIRPWG